MSLGSKLLPKYLYLTNLPLDKMASTLQMTFWNAFSLTHWGRVTHICVSKLSNIGSDNGLSPDQPQTIIWTNAAIFLTEPLGTNSMKFDRNSHIFIHRNAFENVCKMAAILSRPQCVHEEFSIFRLEFHWSLFQRVQLTRRQHWLVQRFASSPKNLAKIHNAKKDI